jgi:drug/metabolite transporter (DMT)-like permease
MALVGCVAIVVGAYAAAQASILVKAKAANIHPASLVFCQMICGLPAIVIYSIVREGNPLTFSWSWKAFVCVIYLSVLGTVAAFWLYYWLLSRIESTKAMMISLVTPLLAVVIGNVILGETLPPLTFLGGLLIIASIGLIVLGRKTVRPQIETGELR